MFLGHFAAGVATKPAAATLPIWALLLDPQALDIVFLPLVGLGVEEFEQGDYGQDGIEAFYSHSIVSAVFISAAVFWIGKKLWKSSTGAWILTLLSFSHWPIDLVVHHEDLPILPGNIGDLPLLGFGSGITRRPSSVRDRPCCRCRHHVSQLGQARASVGSLVRRPDPRWRHVHGDGSFGPRPTSGMIPSSTDAAPGQRRRSQWSGGQHRRRGARPSPANKPTDVPAPRPSLHGP